MNFCNIAKAGAGSILIAAELSAGIGAVGTDADVSSSVVSVDTVA